MRQIRVLEVKDWKQDPKVEKTIPAFIVIKNTTFTRVDDEVITVNEAGEEKIEYKARYTATCLFEVYPDEEAFKRRSLPITMFKEKFSLDSKETINTTSGEILLLLNEEFIFNQLKEKTTFIEQEFKSGEVKTILL
jgi:hypothetical protein